MATNYLAFNVDYIAARVAGAESIRETWREWNPQREAAKKLEQLVLNGTISLEVGHLHTWCETLIDDEITTIICA